MLEKPLRMAYPENPIKKGAITGLYCYSETPVVWKFQNIEIKNFNELFLSQKIYKSYIESVIPIYIYYLMIHSVHMQHTGIYSCHYVINGSHYYDDGLITVQGKSKTICCSCVGRCFSMGGLKRLLFMVYRCSCNKNHTFMLCQNIMGGVLP